MHRRARVIAGRSTGCAGLGLVLLGVVGSVGCSRETFVVPHEKAFEVVALFGEAWSEPIGELRITGGRMEGGIIRVALAGPGRTAEIRLEHVRVAEEVGPGDVVVERPNGDVRVVLGCLPACDAATQARLRAVADRVLDAGVARMWIRVHGFAVGRESDVAVVLALALSCVAVGLGGVALWRARPLPRRDIRDAVLAGILTLLVTSLLGEPSMANWYSINLPPGASLFAVDDRNGIAAFLPQAVVRALLPWTDRTLFTFNLFLHAVAGGVYCLAFAALNVRRGVALPAVLLWSVLPMSVRVGWSDSQNVQADLLFALLLLVWLRGQDEARWPERLLAPVLVALLPLVRLEALALAPLALPFGWLVGNRAPARRVRDACVYGVALGLSAYAVVELFVGHYDMPVPDWTERLRALVDPSVYRGLLGQFVAIESGMPNWFPWPATALLAIGVVTSAVCRPALLATIVVAFCLPQIVLDRLFNAEGLVGARYFLPLLALLALVAADGLALLAEASRRVLASRFDKRAGAAAAGIIILLGVSPIVIASAPLYRYEYAFQAEHRFLRRTLADLTAGARVLHLPARGDDRLRADPDCCLDPPVSPLALAFPSLHFETIPIRLDRPRLPAAVDERTYYYEGALCRLAPTDSSERRNPGLSRDVQELCAELARDPRLEVVASDVAPSSGFWSFLEPGDVPLNLYRIRPSGTGSTSSDR